MEVSMRSSSSLRNLILVTVTLLLFALPSPALAQGIVYGDSVPAGTVVDADLVLVGQNVTIEGTVNGNVFILGNQVRVDGQVNGSLVVIGQNLSIGGGISGGAYALGLTMELDPGSELERDLYVLSLALSTGQDTSIQRDLFALGLDAGLNGSVGRDLHTAIGPIQLYNGLMRLLGFEELTINLHFELPQPTTESPTEVEATPASRPGRLTRARLSRTGEASLSGFDWAAWGVSVAREWIVLAIIAMLVFWLARSPLETSCEPILKRPWRTGLSGFLVLVVSLNLFVLAALLGALVFSLGLALNYVGLWQLSIALWIAAYALLALACVLLWFFIVYGTKVIALYALSGWLASLLSTSHWVKALALLLGTLVYALLRSLPMVGWAIAVILMSAGMGTAWAAYRASRRPESSETESTAAKAAPRKKRTAKA